MHLTPRLLRRLAACALHDTPIAPACLLSHRPPPVSARSLPHRRTPISPPPPLPPSIRTAHSASSSRWQTRQARDPFTQSAKVAGLKSRAAYKLLQLQAKHRIFRRGATVVDLGYAPGSWAQVAMHAVGAGGRVVGVDLLPATPPRGVSTIQGNFLSAAVREGVREYVRDEGRGRVRAGFEGAVGEEEEVGVLGRMAEEEEGEREGEEEEGKEEEGGKKEGRAAKDAERGRVVDVVLSDMCEPWPQTTGSWINSVSNPYHRLMNTSGIPFRDHAGSMDLCYSALDFGYDTLRTGGHFVCKFYQGGEDKLLEKRLKRLFSKVHRDKPAASRSESREGYFVALRRKHEPAKEEVFAE